MPPLFIDCPHCGWDGKIDESMLGHQIKCPKCKASFKAEIGGSYDLAEPPPVTPPMFGPTPDTAEEGPRTKNKAAARKPKPAKSKVDPEIQARLEAWADDE